MGYDSQLFNPELTSGSMSSITWLTGPLSAISVVIISIVGLFITMSAIFKQATHGLYATNKKFFDKVDMAHQSQIMDIRNPGSLQGSNTVTKTTGLLISILLNICPNVKAITDFDDDTVDAKTFFTRSLPMACVQIFIGVFIFYGYTSQFGQKFSQFGTAALDVFFLNIDPIAIVNSLPTKFATLDLATDGSKDSLDSNINKGTKATFNAYVGRFDDIEKDRRNRLGLDIEHEISTFLNGNAIEYAGNTDKYSLSVDSIIQIGEPDISRIDNKVTTKNDKTIATFVYKTPASTFDTGTANARLEEFWVKTTFTFTEKSQKVSTSSVECNMAGGTLSFNGTKEATLDLGNIPNEASIGLGTNAQAQIGSVTCKVTMDISGTRVKLIFTPTVSNQALNTTSTEITNVTNVTYKATGGVHKIRSIHANGNSGQSIVFTPTSSTSKVSSWTFGQSPVSSKESAETTSANDTSSSNTNDVEFNDD